MNMTQLVFYLFSALLLASALIVVTVKNLVRSIFMFFVVLFSLAALYVFALADFIAVAQVIIYVGGVLVLMLFAFLLSDKRLLADRQPVRRSFDLQKIPAIFVSVLFLFILVSIILQTGFGSLPWLNSGNKIGASDNTVHLIGISMMTRYLLPFEVVSVFLMMALIGAAHMARKEKKA